MAALIQTPLSFNAFLPLGATKEPSSALQRFNDSLQFTADVAALQTLDAPQGVVSSVGAGIMTLGLMQLIGFGNDKSIKRAVAWNVYSSGPLGAGITIGGFPIIANLSSYTAGQYSFTQVGDRYSYTTGQAPMWTGRFSASDQYLINSGGSFGMWIDTLVGVHPAMALVASWVQWQASLS